MITHLELGTDVVWEDQVYRIEQIKNLTEAVIVNEERNFEIVKLTELQPVRPKSISQPRYSSRVGSEKDWKQALKRLEIIKPLINKPSRTFADVEDLAKKTGKGTATIYRWLRRFEETGVTTSLIRDKRDDFGKTRIDPEVEEIIGLNIQRHYLKPERKSVVTIYDYIKADCFEAGVTPPSLVTVHNRIKALKDKTVIKGRYSAKTANQKYEATPGQFPHDNIPYSVVQIDHTPVDVLIVDDEHRSVMGKPYLTIAIDVATKMIGGFVLDLYEPSALTAGLCISHAMMQKDSWLSLRGLDYEWPIYGKIQKIHVDNAKEFTGTMISRGCQQHNIILENRPKGTPRYGPHVERGFKTFMGKVAELPGSTHGSVARKGDYDSDGKACFTLSELEKWFATYLLGHYHLSPHKGQQGQPPLKRYEQLILGDSKHLGVGAPIPLADEETMVVDFTPFEERTIQTTGVVIDYLEYYCPALDKWINAKDPQNPKQKRKFVFARDPRSLKRIHFFDPELEQYLEVPFRDISLPDLSLWEHKNALKRLKECEFMHVDQTRIIQTVLEMREQEALAVQKTLQKKKARASEKRKLRNQQKRLNEQKSIKLNSKENEMDESPESIDYNLVDDVTPFDVDM